MSNQSRRGSSSRPLDIDRSLAIFYHPLFQEITNQWTYVLFRKGKKETSPEYRHPQDFQMNFLEFIEFNLKVQKCLLPQFDLSNAFVSALNDWVKEITECFHYSDLYNANETDITNIKQEIEAAPQENLSLPAAEYLQFIEMFKGHEAFKIVKFHITNEVFCKFLFDLCTTWCEQLDIELFIFFLFSVFMQISSGDEGLQSSSLKNTFEIENLKFEFFKEFEQQKERCVARWKKQLRYYRAWCEWNYLRLNEMGEAMILRLSEIFKSEEDQDRIFDLVAVFERVIDTVNSEISTQIDSFSQKPTSSVAPPTHQPTSHEAKRQMLIIDQILQKATTGNTAISSALTTPQDAPRQQQQQQQQPGLSLQKAEKNQQNLLHHTIHSKLQEQLAAIQQHLQVHPENTEQQFEITLDDQGRVLIKKVVRMPIFGQRIFPGVQITPQAPHARQNMNHPALKYQIDPSILQSRPQRATSLAQPTATITTTTNNNKPSKTTNNAVNQSFALYGQNDKFDEPLNKKVSLQLNSVRSSRGAQRNRLNSSFQRQRPESPLLEPLSRGSQGTSGTVNQHHHNVQSDQEQQQQLQSPSQEEKQQNLLVEKLVGQSNPLLLSVQLDQKLNDPPLAEMINEGEVASGATTKRGGLNENSVLVPEFLRSVVIIEKEQVDKDLHAFHKGLDKLKRTDVVNAYGNSIYQNKRDIQRDVAKEVIENPHLAADYMKLQQKVNRSFDVGKGKAKHIERILSQDYSINVLPRPLKSSRKVVEVDIAGENAQKLSNMNSMMPRFNSRDYQYELLAEQELIKVKEKSMIAAHALVDGEERDESMVGSESPRHQSDYRNAVERYRQVWKKYLSEEEMYMLNDWDSLYKIIIILKKKFAEDTRENYLQFLNLDLCVKPGKNKQEDDDMSTQASQSHLEVEYVPDKEKFKKDIERLLKRDERRKKRRAQRRKAKISVQNKVTQQFEYRPPKKQPAVVRFKSAENRSLFRNVFITPILPQIISSKKIV